MVLLATLCYLAIFANSPACRELASRKTTTTATMSPPNPTNVSDPLAPQRLRAIKNSYTELDLLSKTQPSDFIFDFDKAVTGISTGTGGKSVAATVCPSSS